MKEFIDGQFEIENNVLIKYHEKDGITDVVIPESVTKIKEKAFINCKKIRSIKIPEGIKKIDDKTFFGCESLTNISLPNSLVKICNNAFNIIRITGFTSSNLKYIEIYSYKVFCLLNEHLKKFSISSVIKNYNSGNFKASEKEINKIRKYILERRLELLSLAITNQDYNLFNYLLGKKIYSKEEIDMYISRIIELKINQKSPEIIGVLLKYKDNNFGFDDQFNYLTLDDDEDTDEKGKVGFRG